ncbi:MAG: hypothetical protein IJX88_03040 [Clostridia bacterium]|nr:hypothetical protein [Clostridia bacterium]
MKHLILTTSPFLGIPYLCILFIFCFLGVHILHLARLGLKYQANPKEKKEEKPKEEQKAPAEQPQEPIYYIVERKKKTRSSYSEPKQIRFK